MSVPEPISPGEILQAEFLDELGMSVGQLAAKLHVPESELQAVVEGKSRIGGDLALRLSQHFRISPEFWLNLQMRYDLELAEQEAGEAIRREVQPAKPADAAA